MDSRDRRRGTDRRRERGGLAGGRAAYIEAGRRRQIAGGVEAGGGSSPSDMAASSRLNAHGLADVHIEELRRILLRREDF